MRLDASLSFTSLYEVPQLTQTAEQLGFDGLWTSETHIDPFLPLALAAEHTRRLSLGTAIAIAFARSPAVLAQTAWDLQRLSQGRFILGLGTQVKAHIERRFGMTWDAPSAKLAETVQAIRAIWHTWQTGDKLNFRGQFYKLTLMPPFFNPGPIDYPHIPIYTAGVNQALCRLAGEWCDGFHVHPFHTVAYLQSAVLPAIEAGLAASNRRRNDITLVAPVFAVAAENEAELGRAVEAVRRQLSFYASTPSYAGVMDLHGWNAAREVLSKKAVRGHWDEMPPLITDEMVDTFAVIGRPHTIRQAIAARYDGLVDRVMLYRPFKLGEEDLWRAVIGPNLRD